jgi:hypothetical protein
VLGASLGTGHGHPIAATQIGCDSGSRSFCIHLGRPGKRWIARAAIESNVTGLAQTSHAQGGETMG